MGSVSTVYLIGLYLGRRSLLSTRINRRVAGIIGLCSIAPMVHRIFAVQTGESTIEVLISDLVMTAALATAAGLTLHSGFFFGATIFIIGAAVGTVVPQTLPALSLVYSCTAVSAILAVAMSWRRWESELRVDELPK